MLDGYENDPRRITNIVDGNNLTCDSLHVWLAPYSEGQEHSITITLDNETRLSMLRLWNYNKSRTHSYRGVRRLRIKFDENVIFEGEIRKAPGMLTEGPDKCCEIILFTVDEVILQLIDSGDAMACSTASDDDPTKLAVEEAFRNMQIERPQTADGSRNTMWRSKEIKHDYMPYEDVVKGDIEGTMDWSF